MAISNFRDVALQTFREYSRHLARAVGDLTAEQLKWRPAPDANHLLWMVWQIGRIEDRWVVGYVGGREEVWSSQGFASDFGMPADSWGYGMSSDDVSAMPDVTAERLLAYHAAVRSAATPIIESLSLDDLQVSHDEQGRNPDHPNAGPTVGNALAHLISQEGQYVGNVRYVAGSLPR